MEKHVAHLPHIPHHHDQIYCDEAAHFYCRLSPHSSKFHSHHLAVHAEASEARLGSVKYDLYDKVRKLCGARDNASIKLRQSHFP